MRVGVGSTYSTLSFYARIELMPKSVCVCVCVWVETEMMDN